VNESLCSLCKWHRKVPPYIDKFHCKIVPIPVTLAQLNRSHRIASYRIPILPTMICRVFVAHVVVHEAYVQLSLSRASFRYFDVNRFNSFELLEPDIIAVFIALIDNPPAL